RPQPDDEVLVRIGRMEGDHAIAPDRLGIPPRTSPPGLQQRGRIWILYLPIIDQIPRGILSLVEEIGRAARSHIDRKALRRRVLLHVAPQRAAYGGPAVALGNFGLDQRMLREPGCLHLASHVSEGSGDHWAPTMRSNQLQLPFRTIHVGGLIGVP